MTDYDAVIFDNDGVLVEPPPGDRQIEAARAAFADFGIEDVDENHLAAIASGVRYDRLCEVCSTHDLEVAALWERRNDHDRRRQHADMRAGERTTYDDVVAIADCGVSRGVVSNNHHATVEFLLEHFDIGDLFETYYGREPGVEGLHRKKPDPHYLERACEDLGAATALYVGDRESDVRAARNAGLDSAFLRRDHVGDVALDVEPTYEIETLAALPDLVHGRTD